MVRGRIGARIGAGGLLTVGLLTQGLGAAHAQNPQDILKKMVAVYQSATSFQGTVIRAISGKDPQGKPVSMTQTQIIKYKSPGKLRVETTNTGSGALAEQARKAGKQTAVTDGKMATVYASGTNQYVKVPVTTQPTLIDLMRLKLPTPVPGASMDGSSTVAGRAAYVIKVTPKLPPEVAKLPAEQRKAVEQQFKQAKPTRIMVDKQNFHLLKLEQGAGAINSITTYGVHTLNAALPDSTFVFALPAGAKEVKQPTPPPGGGGMPSAPNPPKK